MDVVYLLRVHCDFTELSKGMCVADASRPVER